MVDYSKGVDSYAYMSDPRFSVEADSAKSAAVMMRHAAAPGEPTVGAMMRSHREISSDHLGWTEHSARYWLTAFQNGGKFFQGWAEIAPSTGNLNGSNMGVMLDTRSILNRDSTICYGFADSGAGRSHQVYMYVTDSYAQWMEDLTRSDKRFRNLPLNCFALPGSHDSGMFTGVESNGDATLLLTKLADYYGTLDNAVKVLLDAWKNYPAYVALACRAATPLMVDVLGTLLVAALGAATAAVSLGVPRRALINLAYTQKDSIAVQLAVGIRYFDFRPGYNMPFYRSDRVLRHQHMFIPGCTFRSFLTDIREFLARNTGEVVVVNLKYSGFMDHKLQDPALGAVESEIKDVFDGGSIIVGDADDLIKPIGSLVESKRRLILLRNPKTWGSYDETVYNTDNPGNIIAAIDGMLKDKAANDPEENSEALLTVLELQGTYSLTARGAGGGICSLSDASSPLLYTKPIFDNAIYPWMLRRENVTNRCGSQLLVLLNDFADNALVSHAIAMTKQRAPAL